MKKIISLLIPIFLFCGNLYALDEFAAVKCGKDIPASLIGKRMSNEPVVSIEARHKDLDLKDLGADEINDHMNIISWRICGDEYMVLESNSVIRDVISFPPHSKSSPEIRGACVQSGVAIKEAVVGVIGAKQAWKIDEKIAKFVKLSTEGLRCSQSDD